MPVEKNDTWTPGIKFGNYDKKFEIVSVMLFGFDKKKKKRWCTKPPRVIKTFPFYYDFMTVHWNLLLSWMTAISYPETPGILASNQSPGETEEIKRISN